LFHLLSYQRNPIHTHTILSLLHICFKNTIHSISTQYLLTSILLLFSPTCFILITSTLFVFSTPLVHHFSLHPPAFCSISF
jgi:hypothetical protein